MVDVQDPVNFAAAHLPSQPVNFAAAHLPGQPVNFAAAHLPGQPVNFVGRKQLCSDVVSFIKADNRLIVLNAPPACGKSEATTVIGYMLLKEGFSVLYFCLKEVITIYDATVLILETLGQVASSTEPVLQLHRFFDQSIARKTVLILDNTENVQEEKLLDFLEKIGKFAHNLCTLVTTTLVLSQPMLHPFGAKSIQLAPLSENESLELFGRYVPDMAIPERQARQLCNTCMGIPLLLEIAASHVKEGSDIVSLIRDLEAKFLQTDSIYFQHMKVFFSGLPKSLKVVLAHLAVFPTPFTFNEVRMLFHDDPEKMKADFTIHSELCKLLNYALLKFDKEKKTYQLHNVIRSFCKSRIDEVVFKSHSQAVYKYIGQHLTSLENMYFLFISREGKHALEEFSQNKRNTLLAFSLAIDYEHKPAIDVSTEVVNLLAKCLNIKEFEKIYQVFSEKEFVKQDKKLHSDCLTSLGFKRLCYHGIKNAKEAFEVLSEADKLQQELPCLAETEERAHCISKLGLCHARQGNIENGIQMIEQGINIRKKLHKRMGGDNREMLVCGGYCDLAMALSTANKVEAAVEIWETKCLEGYRHIMGSHPFTATLLQYIGDAYHKLENYEKAEDYKREALKMRKHLLTTNHQDTARSFSSLAQTLEKLGHPQEAVEMLRDTLSIQSKVWASPEDTTATKREIQRIHDWQLQYQ